VLSSPLQFFGAFLQIDIDEQGSKLSSSKNVCHKPATTKKQAANGGGRKYLMKWDLMVGARGFEPPTSRSRTVKHLKT